MFVLSAIERIPLCNRLLVNTWKEEPHLSADCWSTGLCNSAQNVSMLHRVSYLLFYVRRVLFELKITVAGKLSLRFSQRKILDRVARCCWPAEAITFPSAVGSSLRCEQHPLSPLPGSIKPSGEGEVTVGSYWWGRNLPGPLSSGPICVCLCAFLSCNLQRLCLWSLSPSHTEWHLNISVLPRLGHSTLVYCERGKKERKEGTLHIFSIFPSQEMWLCPHFFPK